MSGAKHIPGPWSYWSNCSRDGGMVTQDGTGAHVAAPALYRQPGLTEANARLIAAAPDLLRALQACQRELRGMGFKDDRITGALQMAARAVASATGEDA